jgi:hypothetical protein
MGRYSGGGRATTSGFMRLDVRYLQRKGFLRFGTSRFNEMNHFVNDHVFNH